MYAALVPCIKFVSQIRQVTLNTYSLRLSPKREDAANFEIDIRLAATCSVTTFVDNTKDKAT